MFANRTYDFGSGLVPYPNAGNGPYTHYVDKTSPTATDTNNPYGTPDRPRLTIPSSLAPGSVVEIHGSGYVLSLSTNSVTRTSDVAGTAIVADLYSVHTTTNQAVNPVDR